MVQFCERWVDMDGPEQSVRGAHLVLVPLFLFLYSYIKSICTFVYLIILTIRVKIKNKYTCTFHFFLSFSFSFLYFFIFFYSISIYFKSEVPILNVSRVRKGAKMAKNEIAAMLIRRELETRAFPWCQHVVTFLRFSVLSETKRRKPKDTCHHIPFYSFSPLCTFRNKATSLKDKKKKSKR